jgi:prepilin-type N-terminal cleavage/methylation domain-containing protein
MVKKHKWILSLLTDQAGMTLIEIIITVLIIGVFAGTVLVQFRNTSDSAKTAACIANQAALTTTLNIFLAQTGDYPNQIEDLFPYLVEEEMPECPSGGTYLLIDRSEIQCSLEEHQ